MNLLMRECLFYLGTVKEQKKIYVLLGPLIKRSSKVVHIRSLVQPYKEALRFGCGHTTDGNAPTRSLSYDRQTRMVNYL